MFLAEAASLGRVFSVRESCIGCIENVGSALQHCKHFRPWQPSGSCCASHELHSKAHDVGNGCQGFPPFEDSVAIVVLQRLYHSGSFRGISRQAKEVTDKGLLNKWCHCEDVVYEAHHKASRSMKHN